MNKHIVEIKEIDWMDKDNPEAEVKFKIGDREYWAFAHPCDFLENETLKVQFEIIEEEILESVFWNENKDSLIKMVSSESRRCSYACYGIIEDINPVKINCGDITFLNGDWINDKNVIGAYVYFYINRLDIIKG